MTSSSSSSIIIKTNATQWKTTSHVTCTTQSLCVSRRSSTYFNRRGELRHIKSLRYWPLAEVLFLGCTGTPAAFIVDAVSWRVCVMNFNNLFMMTVMAFGTWLPFSLLFYHGNPSFPTRKNGGSYPVTQLKFLIGRNLWEIGTLQDPVPLPHLYHLSPPFPMLFFFPFVHPTSLRMPRLQKYHMHAIEAKSLASFLLPMFLGSLTFLDAGIFWGLWCLKPCSQKQSCSFISHCFHTCCLDCPAIQTCRSMKLVLDWAVQTDADTSAGSCRCIASVCKLVRSQTLHFNAKRGGIRKRFSIPHQYAKHCQVWVEVLRPLLWVLLWEGGFQVKRMQKSTL